jgi:recombination protein RecR
MQYPDHLLKLITVLKKFPGVGTKTAERFAFHMIDWPQEKLEEMAEVIANIKKKLKNCASCGALIGNQTCSYCHSSQRDPQLLCIVASPKDIFLIEETGEYHGHYHVLGFLFSPIRGQILEGEVIEKIKMRISQQNVRELIIALDSTLEGDATALFLKKELHSLNIPTTRLAFGLPIGSSLEFIDGGTLARALTGRRHY